jgi:hypothetical protein
MYSRNRVTVKAGPTSTHHNVAPEASNVEASEHIEAEDIVRYREALKELHDENAKFYTWKYDCSVHYLEQGATGAVLDSM